MDGHKAVLILCLCVSEGFVKQNHLEYVRELGTINSVAVCILL